MKLHSALNGLFRARPSVGWLAQNLVWILVPLYAYPGVALQPPDIVISPYPYKLEWAIDPVGSGGPPSKATPILYDHPVSVSLRANKKWYAENQTLRYTLDGSTPDQHSLQYVAPIEIANTSQLTVHSYDSVTGEQIESSRATFYVVNTSSIWHPKPGTSWQWQLSGTIGTQFDVDMYDIDLFESSATLIQNLQNQGRKVICYFSAGSYETGRPDEGDFDPATLGKALDGWPDERWLDIRNSSVLAIMGARLDLAVIKGCDGVEPDNVDGYQNDSGFPLTGSNQIVFNTWLANQAHARGLSIGLKNDLDQVLQLAPLFDWALNEECFQYQECETLQPFIALDKAVFGVEYVGQPSTFCPQAKVMGYSWLKKNMELDAFRTACPLPNQPGTSAIPAVITLLLGD